MKGDSSLCIGGATHRSLHSYGRKAMLIDIDVVVIKCALALETGIWLIRTRRKRCEGNESRGRKRKSHPTYLVLLPSDFDQLGT